MMKTLLLCLLLVLSFTASPVLAAISCVDAGAVELATGDPTDPQTISYATPSPCSNCVTFVGVGQRAAGVDNVVSVTHAGNAMTATAAAQITDPMGAKLFYIVNPTAGTNDVVVDWNGVQLDASYIIWTCSGVKLSAPVHDATGATAATGNATVTVSNLVAGDVVIDFHHNNDGTTLPSVGANQTAIHTIIGGTVGAGASFQAAADGGVMSWTIAVSGQWGQQAVALTPASSRRPSLPIMLGD